MCSMIRRRRKGWHERGGLGKRTLFQSLLARFETMSVCNDTIEHLPKRISDWMTGDQNESMSQWHSQSWTMQCRNAQRGPKQVTISKRRMTKQKDRKHRGPKTKMHLQKQTSRRPATHLNVFRPCNMSKFPARRFSLPYPKKSVRSATDRQQ